MPAIDDPLFRQVVEDAAAALHDGDPTHAAELLQIHLSELDPATAEPDPLLHDGALLYAEATMHDEHNLDTADWAFYAQQSAVALFGRSDDQTIETTSTLADVLLFRDSLSAAISLYQHVVADHHQAGRQPQLTDTRLRLTAALHTAGRCGQATQDATTALQQWITDGQHDHDPAATGTYLLHVLHLLDQCGRISDALTLLDQHRHLLPNAPGLSRDQLILTARIALGQPQLIRRHHHVCAVRLDARHGLTPARRRTTYSQIRHAFLDALTGNAYDANPATRRRVTTPAIRAEAIRRFTTGGQSIPQIAADLGWSPSTVRRILTTAQLIPVTGRAPHADDEEEGDRSRPSATDRPSPRSRAARPEAGMS